MSTAWKLAPVLCVVLVCQPTPAPPPTPSPTPPQSCLDLFCPPGTICKVQDDGASVACVPIPPDPCPSPEPVLSAWKLERIGVVSNWTDATPLVHGCAYCAEIGLPTLPDGVTPRCDCPVRPEDSPQRPACEREATGVTAWSCPSGGTLEIREGNPYQARCVGGQAIRVCDATGTVCATRAQ